MNDASPTSLVRYDAMCRAIDAAFEVDEVKDIRDKAIALETYARQAKNVEAERQACEIRLRAERKAGHLTKQLEKAPGARTDQEPLGSMQRGRTKREALEAARRSQMWSARRILGLDIPAIAKIPGGEVMQLVRDILNDEAFRISTFEELLIKHGLGGGLLNAERMAVVRALGAWSDATTLILAAGAGRRSGRPDRTAQGQAAVRQGDRRSDARLAYRRRGERGGR